MTFSMVDGSEKIAHPRIAAAALDSNGGLRRGGQPFLRIESDADIVFAQSVEPGSGEERRIGLARIEFGHTRGDIAANANHP